ncbi:tetratricopeptide repeat protein [Aurantiacibacter flavus]|uniref:Tetratricopeptide repeat protein n=1 Tax=Aurantiacibacter flavus TaxID=3145232 RepID=A0ABV0CW90_9SPHN
MIHKFAFSRFTSRAAMALALAGGALFATSAQAQDYSRGFREAYVPVAEITSGEEADWAAARDQFDSVLAAIENDDDRNAAGNMALMIGNNLNDPVWQRRGLELMLESGKVEPERIGQFQFFVGNLAYNAKDYAEARAALEAALAAGYTENDPQGLIIETYLQEDNVPGAVAYIEKLQPEFAAAGRTIPVTWIERTLGAAYSNDMYDESIALAKALVKADPSSAGWLKSLQVVGAIRQLEPQVELDLLRLMRETDALSNRAEYIRYIEALDPRIMSNEVLPVMAEAVEAGLIDTGDNYYVEVKSIADSRAATDRSDPDGTFAEGQSGDALDAMGSANVLWSLGDYARAETLYQAAADKGGDLNEAMTRKGMAQVMQGKYDEGIATLGQVTGPRKPVADMWVLYAEQKAG